MFVCINVIIWGSPESDALDPKGEGKASSQISDIRERKRDSFNAIRGKGKGLRY